MPLPRTTIDFVRAVTRRVNQLLKKPQENIDGEDDIDEEEEDDSADMLGTDLPPGLSREDPLFRQAYADVMIARIRRVHKEAFQEPTWVSGQQRPHRPEIARLRRRLSQISLPLVVISAVLYWLSKFIVAAFAGALAICSSVALAAFLLGEVLYGSGIDKEAQFVSPRGPHREYSFRPFIDSPLLLFGLIGIVIVGVVLGYSELFASLFAAHKITFSKTLDPASSIYFSLVTFATVGYGDFYPNSTGAKLLVCSEIIIALFVLAVVLATSTSWMLSRRAELTEERKSAMEERMQRVEGALKNAGVGLYQDKEQLLADVIARMQELKLRQQSTVR